MMTWNLWKTFVSISVRYIIQFLWFIDTLQTKLNLLTVIEKLNAIDVHKALDDKTKKWELQQISDKVLTPSTFTNDPSCDDLAKYIIDDEVQG